MEKQELKQRTKTFALRIIKLVQALPKNAVAKVIGNQLLRAGTAVAANYRAACRARSKVEFVAKIGIVVEESDECCFWLELIIESNQMSEKLVSPLLKEADEITAIMYSTRNSASKNLKS